MDNQAKRANQARNALNRNGEKKIRKVDPTTCDHDYTASEMEFLHAIEAYKQKTGRMFPTHSEYLAIIRSLGYQKMGMIA